MNFNHKIWFSTVVIALALSSAPETTSASGFLDRYISFSDNTINTAAAGYTFILDGQMKDIARRLNCKVDQIIGRKNGYLFCSYL